MFSNIIIKDKKDKYVLTLILLYFDFSSVGKQYRDQKYLEAVGRKLIEIREKQGITQEKLAELTKFDTRQIGRIERAETNTSISMIKAIADKLNIGIDEMLNIK